MTEQQTHSVGKESSCIAGNTGDSTWIPGLGRSLEKEMATHFSILARKKIEWTEESGGLQCNGVQRVRHD